MLGTRQSGDMGFAIGNIYSDASILKMAADTSSILIEKIKNLCLRKFRYKGQNPEYRF